MPKRVDRDVFVVAKLHLHGDALDAEVQFITRIISTVESLTALAVASEIYDLNLYKTIRKPKLVARQLQGFRQRPFVFVGNKN